MAGDGIYFGNGPKSRQDRPVIFLMEGIDDAYFFDTILAEKGADPANVGIVYCQGADNISKNVSELLKTRHFVTGVNRTIVVIRDSDDNGKENLKKLNDDLKKIGFPEFKDRELLAEDIGGVLRQIGYFSIPSISEDGGLEDVILGGLKDDSRYQRAVTAVDGQIEEAGHLDHRSKRIMSIFLSLSPTHWRGCGRAFKAGVFNGCPANLDDIRSFLDKAIAT